MALQASSSSSKTPSITNSVVTGLPSYWNDTAQPPTMEWDKWLDLFTVALLAKHSISLEEVERTPEQRNPRIRAQMRDLPGLSADRKVISLMFLSLGEAASKLLRDKFLDIVVWNLTVTQMKHHCTGCFTVERNRTLDRYKFLSRKQLPGESMQHYWHALNGLAAKCESAQITTTLVHDVFILNMNTKEIQNTLCIEPKENPDDALQYAISYEEGVKSQKSLGKGMSEPPKMAVKSEPVFAVEQANNRECFRCGEKGFTREHVNVCTATKHRCEYCAIVGHLEKSSNQKFPQRKKDMQKRLARRMMQRVNYISDDDSTSESNLVVQVD